MFHDDVVAWLDDCGVKRKYRFARTAGHDNLLGGQTRVLFGDALSQSRITSVVPVAQRDRIQVHVEILHGQKLDRALSDVIFDTVLVVVEPDFERHAFEPHRPFP